MRAFFVRLVGLVGRAGADRDFSAELNSHLQLHIDENLRTGMSPEEARRHAFVKLGGVEASRESHRDRRSFVWFSQAAQDFRYTVRVLRRSPVFAGATVLVLALGIGANTALFSLINPLILQSLAVPEPNRLVRLKDGGENWSYPQFDLVRARVTSLSSVIAVDRLIGRPRFIDEGAARHAAIVHPVSANYFDGLGLNAWRGRVFHPDDVRSGAGGVAVVSEQYWRHRYGSDEAAIGSRFTYARREFTVIGVAPPGFRGVSVDVPDDIWVPFEQSEPANSMLWTRGRWLHVLGRMAPGATVERVTAEATAVAGRPIAAEPGANGFSALRAKFTHPLVLLQGLAVLVLLIACANLAHLMLARGTSRARELAIRRAVGASSARLIRQLTMESALLALVGGVAGLGVAYVLNSTLLQFLPPANAVALENLRFRLEPSILVFSLIAALGTCVLFGLWPAIRGGRPSSASHSIRSEMAPAAGMRGRRALVVGQVALCASLVIGANFFGQTLRNLLALDAGFSLDHLVVADAEIPSDIESTQRLDVLEELRARVAALPGVTGVGFSQIGAMSGFSIEGNIFVRGDVAIAEAQRSSLDQRISPGFLQAMGTRLIAGRDFNADDTAARPAVAIVNETFVRRFLPGGDAIGQRFGNARDADAGIEIVGVVQDTKWHTLRETSWPIYYRPFRQEPALATQTFVIGVNGSTTSVMNAVSGLTAGPGARVKFGNVMPFSDVVGRTLLTERMMANLATGFGLLALLIAAGGLYAVLSYEVGRRRKEIGVRVALGATRSGMQWMILRELLLVLVLALPLGVIGAVAATRSVASMLFELAPTDAVVILEALAVLTLVLIAAAVIPARRAAGIDPAILLKAE